MAERRREEQAAERLGKPVSGAEAGKNGNLPAFPGQPGKLTGQAVGGFRATGGYVPSNRRDVDSLFLER